MDYEQKYKEALEKARQLCAYPTSKPFISDLQELFSELKESEDERIRKKIIEFIKVSKPEWENYSDYSSWIAWLEKQSKERSWKPSKEEMDALYGLAYITNKFDEHKEEVITRLYQDLKREFFNGSSYENMFPTNTSTEDDVRRRSTIQVLEYARSLDTYNQYGKADIDKNISWLEKQGEQKSVDKVKPKFKVGDWVVFNNKHQSIYQVEKIEDGYYVLRDTYGGTFRVCHDESLRLWTIQDAKDGDVLCYEDEISLYKHDIKNCIKQETTFGGFVYYCCYDGKRFIVASLYSLTEQGKKNIHPATKEQRDFLFQKMKEAGYEWDADKKELKKL